MTKDRGGNPFRTAPPKPRTPCARPYRHPTKRKPDDPWKKRPTQPNASAANRRLGRPHRTAPQPSRRKERPREAPRKQRRSEPPRKEESTPRRKTNRKRSHPAPRGKADVRRRSRRKPTRDGPDARNARRRFPQSRTKRRRKPTERRKGKTRHRRKEPCSRKTRMRTATKRNSSRKPTNDSSLELRIQSRQTTGSRHRCRNTPLLSQSERIQLDQRLRSPGLALLRRSDSRQG